jgi:hypothetical protein
MTQVPQRTLTSSKFGSTMMGFYQLVFVKQNRVMSSIRSKERELPKAKAIVPIMNHA